MGWNDHEYQIGICQCDARDVTDIINGIIDVTRWRGNEADCLCPNCGRNDAKVYADGKFPVVYCFSTGCENHNRTVNGQLIERTKELFGERGLKLEPTAAELEEVERRKHLRKIEANARNRLMPQLLKQPPVPLEDWISASPYGIEERHVKEHWKLLLEGLYEEPKWNDGLIWIGSLDESGKPDYSRNFKTVSEWLKCRVPFGPFISPCLFNESRGSRTKEFVCRRDYFIAESDPKGDGTGLGREQFGNVIRWIQKYTTLRAIVDTGGKSLHAWFERFNPPPERVEAEKVGKPPTSTRTAEEWAAWQLWKRKIDLANARDRRRREQFWQHHADFFAVLKGLQCDPAMFQSLTARLPGLPRRDGDGELTGRYQRLIYLNPKYPIAL